MWLQRRARVPQVERLTGTAAADAMRSAAGVSPVGAGRVAAADATVGAGTAAWHAAASGGMGQGA
jgi:hypothetical protein